MQPAVYRPLYLCLAPCSHDDSLSYIPNNDDDDDDDNDDDDDDVFIIYSNC